MVWVYLIGVIGIVATFAADYWFDIDYELNANLALIYAATLTTIFLVLYGIRSNWRGNRVGRTFFVKACILPVVLWQIVTSVWWDLEYPFRQQIRFAIYALCVIAYLSMDILLWQEQTRDRREAERDDAT